MINFGNILETGTITENTSKQCTTVNRKVNLQILLFDQLAGFELNVELDAQPSKDEYLYFLIMNII